MTSINSDKRLPAEWERQRVVLMSFPHEDSDWNDLNDPVSLVDATSVHIRIAQSIAYSEPVYILCKNKEQITKHFCNKQNMTFIEMPTNDTWIRDYGYISIKENNQTKLLDFTFDGWGGKFDASLDNSVNKTLHAKGYMAPFELEQIDFVLEGGSIESDGEGTILSTSKCLCHPNRNGGLSKDAIEERLNKYLGVKRVLWLDYGYLEGDDTDGHIDTLARFVNPETIVYVKCYDKDDNHYSELSKMEKQLQSFTTIEGKPYKLIALPMPKPILDKDGNRLPATYANFLITNKALLYPTYNDKENDAKIGEIFKALFEDKEIIPIDARKLIEQGGSLHCATMQVAF